MLRGQLNWFEVQGLFELLFRSLTIMKRRMYILIKEIVWNYNICDNNLYTENIYLLENIPISIKIKLNGILIYLEA